MKRLLLILLLAFCVEGHAATTEYYVDPVNGDDNNNGTSSSTAFETLGKLFRIGDNSPNTDKILNGANFSAADPCIVYLMNGTHKTNANLDAESVLVDGSYITIKNYPGHSPRLYVDPTTPYTIYTATTFRFYGYSDGGVSNHHNTLDGIELEGGVSYALKIDEWTSDITIKNCKIHGSGLDAVKMVGEIVANGGNARNSGIIFEYNEVYDTGNRIDYAAEGIDAVAISSAVIRHNYFHDINSTCMYFKGNSKDITVEKNFFIRCGTLAQSAPEHDRDIYGAVWLGECTDQVYIPAAPNDFECINCNASNNVVAESPGNAFRAMGCSGCDITNNTVYNSERPYSRWYDWADYGVFHTNISCVDSAPQEKNEDLNFSYNLVVDNLEQGYTTNYHPPIFALGGSTWDSGSTSTQMEAHNNLYYREDGDYLWRDDTTSDSETVLATWKSATGLETDSSVSADGANLLPIQTTPTLDAEDLDNYARGTAVPSNVGADISLILYDFGNGAPAALSPLLGGSVSGGNMY